MKIIILLILNISFIFAYVAEVSAIIGKVKIKRGNNIIFAKVGFKIENKDVIISSKNSKMQIIFKDKTIITIGSNSKFSIKDYLFDNTKNSKAKFSFTKGIIRVLDGEIGKIAPKRFNIKTKNALIGIRGTMFVVEIKKDLTIVGMLEGSVFFKSLTSNKVYILNRDEYLIFNPKQGQVKIKKGFIEPKSIIKVSKKPLTKKSNKTHKVTTTIHSNSSTTKKTTSQVKSLEIKKTVDDSFSKTQKESKPAPKTINTPSIVTNEQILTAINEKQQQTQMKEVTQSEKTSSKETQQTQATKPEEASSKETQQTQVTKPEETSSKETQQTQTKEVVKPEKKENSSVNNESESSDSYYYNYNYENTTETIYKDNNFEVSKNNQNIGFNILNSNIKLLNSSDLQNLVNDNKLIAYTGPTVSIINNEVVYGDNTFILNFSNQEFSSIITMKPENGGSWIFSANGVINNDSTLTAKNINTLNESEVKNINGDLSGNIYKYDNGEKSELGSHITGNFNLNGVYDNKSISNKGIFLDKMEFSKNQNKKTSTPQFNIVTYDDYKLLGYWSQNDKPIVTDWFILNSQDMKNNLNNSVDIQDLIDKQAAYSYSGNLVSMIDSSLNNIDNNSVVKGSFSLNIDFANQKINGNFNFKDNDELWKFHINGDIKTDGIFQSNIISATSDSDIQDIKGNVGGRVLDNKGKDIIGIIEVNGVDKNNNKHYAEGNFIGTESSIMPPEVPNL